MRAHGIILLKTRQLGVGLVEVMVSLAISLVLLLALGYFFVGGRQMNRTNDDVSRMQENGRYAMEIIGKAIRQAGYRLDVSQPLSADPLAGANGAGVGAGALPDTITLRHDPIWVSNAANPLRGEEANCAGEQIISNNAQNAAGNWSVNTRLVEYTFEVDQAERRLRCRTITPTGGNTSTFVADNIENMQISYGVDPDNTGTIASYETAAGVTNFNQVIAIRVSLLVRGDSPSVAADRSQTYTYNGQNVTATDGFLRQVYISTFSIRNPIR